MSVYSVPKPTRTRSKKLYNSYIRENCEYCGGIHWLERHHIVKRSQMGGDERSNIIVLCKNCHIKVHRYEIGIDELRRVKDGGNIYNL